jgi:hypothetical protein
MRQRCSGGEGEGGWYSVVMTFGVCHGRCGQFGRVRVRRHMLPLVSRPALASFPATAISCGAVLRRGARRRCMPQLRVAAIYRCTRRATVSRCTQHLLRWLAGVHTLTAPLKRQPAGTLRAAQRAALRGARDLGCWCSCLCRAGGA